MNHLPTFAQKSLARMPGLHRRVRPFLHDWLGPMMKGIGRARTFGLAAEMSYWLFLALVPLAAVAGWLGARLALRNLWLEKGLLAAIPGEAGELVEAQVREVAAAKGSRFAPVALGTFVWLASTGVHAVFDALEVQAGASRPWWKKRLVAIVACIGLSLGVALVGVLAVGVDRVAAVVGPYVANEPAERSLTSTLVRAGVALAVGVLMIAALYRLGIPREAWARMPAFPGAAFASLLIGALGFGYRAYLSSAGIGNAYEGGLAVIGVTLTTLWLFSVALLLGAELNRVLGQRRARRHSDPTPEHHVAGGLPYPDGERSSQLRAPWPNFAASSFRRTSPRPPTMPSSGRSRWRSGPARRSR